MSQGVPFPCDPGNWNSASPTSISQYTQYCYRFNASLKNPDSALEDRVEEFDAFIGLLHSDPPRYAWYHYAKQIIPCLNPPDYTRPIEKYLVGCDNVRRLIRGVQDIARRRYGEKGECEETDLHYENRMVNKLFMKQVKSIICPDFMSTKEQWERVGKVTMMIIRNESEQNLTPLLCTRLLGLHSFQAC